MKKRIIFFNIFSLFLFSVMFTNFLEAKIRPIEINMTYQISDNGKYLIGVCSGRLEKETFKNLFDSNPKVETIIFNNNGCFKGEQEKGRNTIEVSNQGNIEEGSIYDYSLNLVLAPSTVSYDLKELLSPRYFDGLWFRVKKGNYEDIYIVTKETSGDKFMVMLKGVYDKCMASMNQK